MEHVLSPYLYALTQHDNETVQNLEKQLLTISDSHHPFSSHQPHDQKEGLPFKFVADTLELTSQKKGRNSIEQKKQLMVGLIQKAILSRPSNPSLEVFALLRILLPEMDNTSVYGFKTIGLMKSFARALEKGDSLSGKAAATQLLSWIKEPKPVLDENQQHIIILPEVALARAHGQCFPSSSIVSTLSLVDVAALCQRLTNAYKELHKQQQVLVANIHTMNVHMDTVAEILGGILPSLSYVECKVLVKWLLKTVPMGVGPQTVMQAFGPSLEGFLKVQRDLGLLALQIAGGSSYNNQPPPILCGVPFTPMTCHVTSSPYLMKWLFSKEDVVQKYLTPKDGRLIIHSSGDWYVPMKGSSSVMRNRFVNLESPAPVSIKTRKKHMLLLREIKRSKALMNEKAAHGYIISYMLYLEETPPSS